MITINCVYCKKYFPKRKPCAEHMIKYHSNELENAGLDAYQSMYLHNHGTLKGVCMACGRRNTEWNYKTGKPYRVCADPDCRRKLRTIAVANGADGSLLQDMEFQKEMQRHRKISGTYTFKDGGKVEFMAKLEQNWLKFCDVIMDFHSCMIQCPPENFTYFDTKDQKTRIYMPDYYLPDYNLLVEIKDEHNGNQAFLDTTRYKVALKDEVMRNQNKYNYIRICGTNYGPFIETLYRIVHEQDDDDKKRNAIIVINETACMEPGEDVDWNDTEPVSGSNITLMIGYNTGTDDPYFIAITDSKRKLVWNLNEMDNLDAGIQQKDCCDPVFQDGGYRMFRYIGEDAPIQEAYNIILAKSAVKNSSEILQILGETGIWFDDGKHVRNNGSRKCDFIETERYFYTPGTLEEDAT